ncbi:sensor histidine kinase [Actinocorallia populi]|uniref:sensor histidine kinase n=1 Tax=Actinocorallia populi TaxID=2079200 RepID=UPI000D087805|nr:sensor histidine kinase [Actinocorallia populi]
MRRSRSQPIRSAIISLLAVPLTALVVLWAFTAASVLSQGLDLARARTLKADLVQPVRELVGALQHERRLSMLIMSLPAGVRPGQLQTYRDLTDSAREVFDRNISSRNLRGSVGEDVRDPMDRLGRELGSLALLRSLVDDGGARNRAEVYTHFQNLVDGAFSVQRAVVPVQPELARDNALLISLSLAREQVSRADAVAVGRLPAAAGSWDRKELTAAVGARDYIYDDILPQLPAGERDRYNALFNTVDYQRLVQMEERITRGTAAVPQQEWDAATGKVLGDLQDLETGLREELDERELSASFGVLLHICLLGGIGLLAVVLSLVIAWRVARRLIRESRALADTVGDFTRDQLPVLAEMVRKGDRITDPGAPSGVRFSVTEIERVFRSFAAARSAVLEAARHEAATMGTVRDVFVNLASRNQALLHRQLSLLDQMERDADDPDELALLFQLDHLATRMRRHAEGLVILAGKAPGRGWRSPVPLMDVVRGAASEVEDYTRVRVLPMPGIAVLGPAVADTIHLLADLIENAVQYSPPDAPIEVSGQGVASGYVLEIEDRGLGLPADVLEQLNERLAAPPDLALSDSARLGLFVVARLARRHDIKVSLRASPYGGTTAVVFLPTRILSTDLPAAEPAEPRERRATAPSPAPLEAAPDPAPAARAASPRPVLVEDPPAEPEFHQGLPRRRRKARSQPSAEAAPAGPAPAAPGPVGAVPPAAGAERSPDDLRLRMSAMQRGWERGRSESTSLADDPSLPSEERP